MEFKRSQEFDDQMESDFHGILGITSAAHEERALSSALALLEEATSPFGGHSIPLELQSAEWNESDNYQVALVRLSSKAVRVGTNSPTSVQPKPVFSHGNVDTKPEGRIARGLSAAKSSCGNCFKIAGLPTGTQP